MQTLLAQTLFVHQTHHNRHWLGGAKIDPLIPPFNPTYILLLSGFQHPHCSQGNPLDAIARQILYAKTRFAKLCFYQGKLNDYNPTNFWMVSPYPPHSTQATFY